MTKLNIWNRETAVIFKTTAVFYLSIFTESYLVSTEAQINAILAKWQAQGLSLRPIYL
jgi:hypothetical protein